MADLWKTRLSRALVPTLTGALLVVGIPAAVADGHAVGSGPVVEDDHDHEGEPHDAGAGDMSGEVVPGPVAPPSAGSAPGIAFMVTPTVPAPPAIPPGVAGTPLDVIPGYYLYSDSCDPVSRKGVVDFGKLVAAHYGKPKYSLSRPCKAGDRSNHYEGRALDWPMDAFNPADKAIGDAVAAWLTADNGAVARRFGIMTVIWNRAIWYSHRPATWQSYSGPSPHTDHLHFSFTWDGAFGRTSWWTGKPVTTADHGTCRVFANQYSPLYVAPRAATCPSTYPPPPASPYPVYLPGASNSHVALAQAHLGVATDGSFGPATRTALFTYQKNNGLPFTGVLDNATWARMLEIKTVAPYAQMVASPDVTGDGHADAVVVDAQGRLAVHAGTGAGRVGPARAFDLGWGNRTVHAPGDWDGDGRGDLMSTDPTGLLFLHRGDGAGGFHPAMQVGHGWTGLRIVPAGDVTTDGIPDLLAIDERGVLYLYRGAGEGKFAKAVQVGRGWADFQLHAAGDMNGDRIVDILGINAAGELFFYAGRGPGTFRLPVQVGHGWLGYGFASGGDFNRDGVGDLLGRDPSGTVWFYAGRDAGTFAKKVEIAQGW